MLDLTIQTGMVYDGWGPHGMTKEGWAQDLKEIERWMDEAFTFVSEQDVEKAEEMLKERGVFA
jgi:hypothetical protein